MTSILIPLKHNIVDLEYQKTTPSGTQWCNEYTTPGTHWLSALRTKRKFHLPIVHLASFCYNIRKMLITGCVPR